VLGVNITSRLSHQAVSAVTIHQSSDWLAIAYAVQDHNLTVSVHAVLVNFIAILYLAQFTVAICCFRVFVQLVCVAQLAHVVHHAHTVHQVSLVNHGLFIRLVQNISNVQEPPRVITSILSLVIQYILFHNFIQFKYHILLSLLLYKAHPQLHGEKYSDGLPT
jgi:hypothetical protein